MFVATGLSHGQNTMTANPSTIVLSNGATSGSSVISWTVTSPGVVSVILVDSNGNRYGGGGTTGSDTVTISQSTTFYLKDASTGIPQGSVSVAVTVASPPPPPQWPKVFIDSPSGTVCGGSIYAQGWAIDSKMPISSVVLQLDGQLIGNAEYGRARPDVCGGTNSVYPNYPGCPAVGWSLGIPHFLPPGNISPGAHQLTAVATTIDGRQQTATANFSVPSGTASIAPPNATGAVWQGTALLTGYAVTAGVSSIVISADGAQLGSATYAPAGAGEYQYAFSLNTTTLSNGRHTIGATLTTTDSPPYCTTQFFEIDVLNAVGSPGATAANNPAKQYVYFDQHVATAVNGAH
ncbi:MAG: hypothetical protein JO061_12360 [Acidobacteriaceae bacterium]|nr:hypothetical protein [Acidobacteriaceae bacterium]